MAGALIELVALHPRAQTAEQVAQRVVAFVAAAERTLELALYDVRLPGAPGDLVRDALEAAPRRGVAVRLAYNLDAGDHRKPIPPPPRTQPGLIESLALPTRGIPGEPDLMHHKYMVRDGRAVWSGSTNWTADSWTLQENVIAIVESEPLAAAFRQNFDELWETRRVEDSGAHDPVAIEIGGAVVHAWFTPGRGRELSQRIATAIGGARHRVRIASPVLTAGAILGTLAEEVAEGTLDLAGVLDGPQALHVFDQWRANEQSAWKIPLLAAILRGAPIAAKPSTAWARDTPHDFMHAKVTVADDTVFCGSFNLSRSGELNAENVLEIHSAALADQMAAFVDTVRARYPRAQPPR